MTNSFENKQKVSTIMMNSYEEIAGVNINIYEKADGDISDAERIQRAVEDNPNGVIVFSKGEYYIHQSINIQNHCSLLLVKEATLKAIAPMEYIIEWNGGMENFFHDFGMFIQGGIFDGAGISGGVRLRNIHHFTMRDSWYKDCKVGLCVGDKSDFKNYELYASNLYMRNEMGIADSIGVCIPSHGDHYLDSIIVVDYQTGFYLKCYATYMSKCHSWVTDIIPDITKTIAFDLAGGIWITLTDCYVDTSNIGVRVNAQNVRMQNVLGYHNALYGRNHTFISYERDTPFYINGGNFVGAEGSDDKFFCGEITPKVHMQWIHCKNLSNTEVLDVAGDNRQFE